MFKTYQNYLIILFLKKVINISLIFMALVFILSVFEEISFFKDVKVGFYFPFLLTALNAPSTLFEIFPFIFLISTQLFFLELIDKNELEVLKINGLNNLKIIKILFLSSFLMGLFLLSFYYSLSSKLKFIYLDLKNSYSNDNKYLAVVKETGLWIKDEINQKIYIINANKIEDNYLIEVSINEFNDNFDLIKVIEADKVDITSKQWIIIKPLIVQNNNILEMNENIIISSHFDKEKINSMFENLTSLNILQLIKLNNDYKLLGYSTVEIQSHLHKLYSFPIYLSIMTILASIIMLNIKRNRPIIFHLVLGIFLSVLIYYFYYLFNVIGKNGKIPLMLSVYLPFLILSFFILIGLVRINEK